MMGERLASMAPPTDWIESPVPPYAVCCVYRHRNAQNVVSLAGEASTPKMLLWALDHPHPALAQRTLGHGLNGRLELLNKLLEATPPGWVVLADDDVRITRGTLDRAVALAAAAGFDLAQPSHDGRSFLNYAVTRRRWPLLARETRFVEQGPCLILSPGGRASVTPFPAGEGMGWGIEALWGSRPSLRLGVLDAIAMRHLQPVVAAGNYDIGAEGERAARFLAAAGFAAPEDQRVEVGRWFWNRRPPWA